MAEKRFRELEADILERGYKAVIHDFIDEAQNFTRVLGYLEEGFGEGPDTRDTDMIKAERELTCKVIWTCMEAIKFSEKYL